MRLPILFLSVSFPILLTAQDTNYVRRHATFVVTSEIAPNPNGIEVFATDSGRFSFGLSYAEFQARLNSALASGRGGVVDFELPFYGDSLFAPDRTRVRAFIRDYQLTHPANPSANPPVYPQDIIDQGRALAYQQRVDFNRLIPVENRTDREFDNSPANPLSEGINFDRMIFRFGLQSENTIEVGRGPQHKVEGALANRERPGAESLNTVNDDYFPSVGIPTYSSGAAKTVSGRNAYHGGMVDLIFDPRDRVQALGFVCLSYGNFQYWQGLGGEPDNPDNLRVWVEFSNGSSQLMTSTTAQSDGGYDTFFGIQAPPGASLTRVWIRVIGRNFRTFVSIDDLAFITEDGIPYLTGFSKASGTVGLPFHRLLETRHATSVTLGRQIPGLSFDPDTGLLSGVPAQAGLFTIPVVLQGQGGVSEEEIVIEIQPSSTAGVPLITSGESTSVVLNRELSPYIVTTTLDAGSRPGDIRYFTLVEEILPNGWRVRSTIEKTGLSFSDGVLSGKPTRADQVGEYLLHLYAYNNEGADQAELRLSVLPVVPSPNFDGDAYTDLAVFQPSGGVLGVQKAAGGWSHAPGALLSGAGKLQSVASGLSPEGFFTVGDFDGDNRSDLLSFSDATVKAYFSQDTGFQNSEILKVWHGWKILGSMNLDGKCGPDLLWQAEIDHRLSPWLLQGGSISWAGYLGDQGIALTSVLSGDFDGNGSAELLFRRNDGRWQFLQANSFRPDGTVGYATQLFTMPADWAPYHVADTSADGKDDILWKNRATGECAVWIMNGAEVPAAMRQSTSADGVVSAQPNFPILLHSSRLEPVGMIDVNNDRKADLLLQHRETKALYLMLVEGTTAGAEMLLLEGTGNPTLLALGDYNGDKAGDALIRLEDNSVYFLFLGGQGLVQQLLWGKLTGDARILTPFTIRNDLSRPPQTDEPLPPWLGADVLGNRYFSLPWWGDFYDPGVGYILHETHGWLFVVGRDPSHLWLYDSKLGWLWTNEQIYPFLFLAKNNFWLWYAAGSVNPRYFYNFNRRRWQNENQF